MLYSQRQPLAEDETAQDNSPRRLAHDREVRSEPRFGSRPTTASMHSLSPSRPRPSIGKRMLRTVTRFAITVLIGVGVTLGWQAYGDTAREMLAARSPLLAWLQPVPTTKPASAIVANPALQLEPLASNLEIVRRSVEQLALNQDQMARNITALQAIDEEIRQKVSAPPAPAQPTAVIPQPRPAPPKPQPSGAAASPAPRPSPAPGPVSLAPR